jgi:hypothetical protein
LDRLCRKARVKRLLQNATQKSFKTHPRMYLFEENDASEDWQPPSSSFSSSSDEEEEEEEEEEEKEKESINVFDLSWKLRHRSPLLPRVKRITSTTHDSPVLFKKRKL